MKQLIDAWNCGRKNKSKYKIVVPMLYQTKKAAPFLHVTA